MEIQKKRENRPILILEIEPSEFEILKIIVQKITAHPSDTPDLFCSQIKQLSIQVSQRIQKQLIHFKNDNFAPFILIKGIILDETQIPPTPVSNNAKIGENTFLSKIQALLLSVIGEMIAYEAEGYGRLFQDIIPLERYKGTQTSLGSTELEIHTEQAFSKLKPDILSLACLKGDLNAFTYILPIQSIIDSISFQDYCFLRKPLWNTGVDLSFKLNGTEFIEGDIRGPMSILNGSVISPELIFDQDLMRGTTPESEEMIQNIIDIYYEKRISYNLVQGDILFINNNKAVHGRSSFSPNYDENDRFIIRCFGTYDYKKSEYAIQNHSRMVSAIYS
jgi:L-asparagine oxygenase